MDRIYEQTMLFDFYGELLTEHQRRVYEDAVYNDLSLSEIAEQQGISRQGAHDLVKRCDRLLQDYERKLHLLERFDKVRDIVREIQSLAGEAPEPVPEEMAAEPQDIPAETEKLPAVPEKLPAQERLRLIGELSLRLLEEL